MRTINPTLQHSIIPLSLLLCVLCALCGQNLPAAKPQSPNIIYILADDFGYGDASCYNPASKIQTPHVDRLAAEGRRFTDAHSPSAVCTPTRYGVLTGRYCWRTRLKYRVLDGFDPPLIDADRLTVPALLKQHGYDTACIGKWHLGMQFTDNEGNPVPAVPLDRKQPPRPGFDVDFSKPITGGPVDRGFDSYFGITASLNMSPFCYIKNDRPVLIPTIPHPRVSSDFITVDEGLRSPDFTIAAVMPAFAGKAVEYIERHARRGAKGAIASPATDPYFLYLPLSSPHLPVIPNEEFRGRSQAGPYGDFVVETDAFVGAVLDALDRAGTADNTLVIFTSDNGGLFHWWEPKEKDDLAKYRISARGALMKELGHQGNAHLRGTKADIWEGGHRVPFVARWPGHVPAGTTSDALVELTDLMATCAAIVDAKLPAGAGEDSRNILPALLGETTDHPMRDFAVHHSLWGVFAIRQGPWKMVPSRGSGGFSQPKEIIPAPGEPAGQLYHLADDPSETTNLWDKHPEIVAQLTALLEEIQKKQDRHPACPHPPPRSAFPTRDCQEALSFELIIPERGPSILEPSRRCEGDSGNCLTCLQD